MISYRDRTFCSATDCLKFSQCPRALTLKATEDAERWWGGPNPPITVFSDPDELDCYEPVAEDDRE